MGVKENFVTNLCNLMKIRNISATELSKRLEIPFCTVLSWRKGEKFPRAESLDSLTKILDCKPADLVKDPYDECSTTENEKNLMIEKLVDSAKKSDTRNIVAADAFLEALTNDPESLTEGIIKTLR